MEPAWKKLGLQVQDDDEGKIQHLETIDQKQINRLKKRKQSSQPTKEGDKKPPKRQKVPKSQRKAPPVKDQLVYLKQFVDDRESWKFSKQKQNWVLKNIKEIPEEFEPYLVKYLSTMQGGGRDRLVDELTAVINEWNETMDKVNDNIEKKIQAKLEKREIELEEPKFAHTKEYASRCKQILQGMGVEVLMKGEDQDPSKEAEPAKVASDSDSSDSSSSSSSDSDSTSDSDSDSTSDSDSDSTSDSDSSNDSDSSSDNDSDSSSSSSTPQNLIVDRVAI